MDEILQSLSAKLGLPEANIRSAVHSLLDFLHTKVDDVQFEQFLAMVPGAKEFMASAPPAPAGGSQGGGFLAGLLGAAGGIMGSQGADLAKVLDALQRAGIPTEKIAPLAQEFITKAKEVAGPETVDSILQKFPLLRSLTEGH